MSSTQALRPNQACEAMIARSIVGLCLQMGAADTVYGVGDIEQHYASRQRLLLRGEQRSCVSVSGQGATVSGTPRHIVLDAAFVPTGNACPAGTDQGTAGCA